MDEINTAFELIEALTDIEVGGYDVTVKFTKVRDTGGDLWTVVQVTDCTEPGVTIEGDYWFWADGTIMQVL